MNILIETSEASCNNTNGTITLSASGGTGPISYSIDNGFSFQLDGNFTGLDSGTYFTVTKDASGCVVRDTVQMTALPTPKIYIGGDTMLCSGQVLQLSVPQLPDYQYIWDDNSTGTTYTITKSGAYSVKVTNQYGCFASTSINVIYRTSTLFTLGNDTSLCKGETIQLSPSPLLSGSYSWSNGSTLSSIAASAPGVYWLKLLNDGCLKSDTIQLSLKAGPQVDLGNDTAICDGQIITLNAGNPGAIYQWQDGSAFPTFVVNAPGKYSIKVKQNGCTAESAILVSGISKPSVDLGKDQVVCNTQTLTLDATAPFSVYQWQDGSTNSLFNVSQAGRYFVRITNVCGSTLDSIQINYENCNCIFSVPNAFTPNNDGRNDLFTPKSQCPADYYDLKIFNRWGQMIFETKNNGLGWDGRYQNQMMPEGTYIWMLDYRNRLTGKSVSSRGTVMLIR